jgi:hypothetical protein
VQRSCATITRSIVIYLVTYALSLLSNGIATVIFPLLILAKTGDISAAGLVVGVTAAVSCVVGIFAGAAIDRFNRRTVSIISDLLSTISVAALPLVDALWGLNMTWFLALAIFGAFGDTPGMTARETLLPRLVELGENKKGDLDRIVGIREALGGILMLVGPSVGGLLVLTFGVTSPTMLATAAASLLAALGTLGITPRAGEVTESSSAVLEDLKIAWKYLLSNQLLLGATLFNAAFAAVAVALQSTILPAFFTEKNHPSLTGFATSCFAIGALIGAGLYALTVGKISRRRWFEAGMVGFAVGFTALGFLISPWFVLGVLVLIGLANGPLSSVLGVASIEATPDEMRGRILGAQNALMLAAPAIITAPIAAVASHFGLVPAGLTLGGLVAIAAITAVIVPTFKNLDNIHAT